VSGANGARSTARPAAASPVRIHARDVSPSGDLCHAFLPPQLALLDAPVRPGSVTLEMPPVTTPATPPTMAATTVESTAADCSRPATRSAAKAFEVPAVGSSDRVSTVGIEPSAAAARESVRTIPPKERVYQ
jgi:hypothetical protein